MRSGGYGAHEYPGNTNKWPSADQADDHLHGSPECLPSMNGPSCWDSDDSDLELSCIRRSKVKKTAEFRGFLGLHKLKLSCTSQCFT